MASKENKNVKKAMENYEVLTGDAEVKRLTDQIDVLAQQNAELSNQIAELTKSYTRVNK